MPFHITPRAKPYIIEAMGLYAKQAPHSEAQERAIQEELWLIDNLLRIEKKFWSYE